ncbi:ornithine cyclodeaminase family protein [Paenibacillus sp. YN15]|uniref:ornithine cyclodeaminase family protein n=1 Tax=Paenibacillus sp. YN15 TaxID=1742774 RepID=UPI000DCF463F|nr:ornithine cyclodeaminase family protein [Paenibacillus sp. YN15]RAV06284.1 ornithine cyclodeaminase family protein [Paenibacillus sp. YN15]
MRVIDYRTAAELLTMEACIPVMEEALADLSAGRAEMSLRQVVPLEKPNLLGLMPGYLRKNGVAGAKLISVFPHSHTSDRPSHQGAVALFDAGAGTLLAVVDGRAITAIRTAAVSAVATRALAREDSAVLAILGTGEQAASHLEAMLQVRPIRQVRVWSRTPGKARCFVEEQADTLQGVEAVASNSVREAVEAADVICTVTASTEPILREEWVRAGTHINAVGACRAPDRELDSALVAAARLYVDRRESALSEAGDYLIPLQEGVIPDTHIVGELGELLEGRIAGRTGSGEITLFKSLGLAIQDLAAAHYIYNQAVLRQKGIDIPW